MSLVLPNAISAEVLIAQLTPTLTIRIYGNDVTPNHASSASSFTEISGGGYTNKLLTFANWTITDSPDPPQGVYNTTQVWTFTGTIDAPGSIFGYYITRNTDGKLLAAERFPTALVPFGPIAGSIIRVLPRISAVSQF